MSHPRTIELDAALVEEVHIDEVQIYLGLGPRVSALFVLPIEFTDRSTLKVMHVPNGNGS